MFKRVSPLVVAFRNEAVPKSIFEVTPDAYAEAFGDRAVLVEIELTRVDPATPLDRRIDQRLPWLNSMPFDGTNIRTLDPHMPRDLPAIRASLAHRVTDYYFRD